MNTNIPNNNTNCMQNVQKDVTVVNDEEMKSIIHNLPEKFLECREVIEDPEDWNSL